MNLKRRLKFYWKYLHHPPWDTGISPPELLAYIATHPPGRALDLGCGTGTNPITLAQAGWQVVGVDFVGRAIETARGKARAAGVEIDLRVADVTRLESIQGPFDLVLDIGCFHSLDAAGMERYIAQLPRLLAADGTFLMYGFFKEPEAAGTGLVEADLQRFNGKLELEHRQNGLERGERVSAWFTFRLIHK